MDVCNFEAKCKEKRRVTDECIVKGLNQDPKPPGTGTGAGP